MPRARAHIFVSGMVQGVFFRAFTEEVARSNHLTGWVRNLPDGRVEALMEGEKGDIGRAMEALYQGPPASRVENIDLSWEEPTGEFHSFFVKYF